MNKGYGIIVEDSTEIAITLNLTLLVISYKFFLKTVGLASYASVNITVEHRNI